MYRNSYFAAAGAAFQDLCDRLLHQLFQNPKRRATQLVELSDLQAMLDASKAGNVSRADFDKFGAQRGPKK